MSARKLFFTIFLIVITYSFPYAQEEKWNDLKELYKNKEYQQIIERLKLEISTSKDLDSKVYFLYSYSLWNTGEKEAAIDVLYIALKRNPSPEIFAKLVKAYASNSKFKGALEICETGLKKFPGDLTLQLQKGYLLARFHKINEALKIAETLKSKYPENPKPLVLEAFVYSLHKQWDKAQIALEWANSLDANNVIYKNNLAIIYERLAESKKQKSKAVEYLKQAKENLSEALKLSSNPVIQSNLQRVEQKLSQMQ